MSTCLQWALPCWQGERWREGEWLLGNSHRRKRNQSTRTTNVTEFIKRFLCLFLFFEEQYLAKACMAFCTSNMTLKGNTCNKKETPFTERLNFRGIQKKQAKKNTGHGNVLLLPMLNGLFQLICNTGSKTGFSGSISFDHCHKYHNRTTNASWVIDKENSVHTGIIILCAGHSC